MTGSVAPKVTERPIVNTRMQRKGSRWIGWTPLAIFAASALAVRSYLPAWGFMGTLAFAIYFGFKWLTWWRARVCGVYTSPLRSVGYFLAWPGMDAHTFFDVKAKPPQPRATDWTFAILKTVLGAVLLWGIAERVPPRQTLLAGWIGMLGLGFLLFFGAFHILALLWQGAGVDARHIMCTPVLARSPSDFWGARWNLAFRKLSYDFVFRPLLGRIGIGGAILAAFLVSGFIHELVISWPAGGGYGLPTMYFMLQGFGVIIERSPLGKRLDLDHGFSGWLFTLVLTAGPVFWLFHPPFVTRVVIPFMHAIGAL